MPLQPVAKYERRGSWTRVKPDPKVLIDTDNGDLHFN